MSVSDRFLVLTDLLLGAVYADDRLEGEEEAAVRRLVGEIIGGDTLPDEIDARINDFDKDAFDLDASAAAFAEDPAVDKRKLLELVAAVFDADEEVDFDEDDYLRRLAVAIGMEESEYKDLALDYDMEDAADVAQVFVSVPPPLPPDAK